MWKRLKATILMVIVFAAYAGSNVTYKIAVSDGMELRILIAYRYSFAAGFMVPLTFFIERGRRPKMTKKIMFLSFLSGLIGGTVTQNLYLEALALTSATFASAMNNLVPVITFFMAICFRLEKLNMRTIAGISKIIGTLIAFGGAMIITLVKGLKIDTGSVHINVLHHHSQASSQSPSGAHTLLAAICALGSCCAFSLLLIIQAKISQSYPCHFSSAALMNVWGAITSTLFAICLDHDDWTQWSLGWNVRLLAAAYTGIVVSGFITVAMSWCVEAMGPIYVSAFNPLMLIFVAIAGFLMLDEQLTIGSIIGGILIVCGLYVVLWGKSKEKMNEAAPTQDKDFVASPVIPSQGLA